ncbi:hypothetical protein DXG01_006135 [Tephrocybe rancida]|nr:hypothetical protein DXG01_006135 [Tephrocybe rancida]
MDDSFKSANAKLALESLVNEELDSEYRRLTSISKDPDWSDSVVVRACEHPPAWRLLKINQDSREPDEEAVFTIEGMLASKKLPPVVWVENTQQEDPGLTIQYRDTPAMSKIKFLKQSIKLVGLGAKFFDDGIEAISIIHDKFDRLFREGQLMEWLPYEGDEPRINAANRLFTPADDVLPGEKHVPFEPAIDPAGILGNLAKKGFVRTEDNVVEYMEQKSAANGEHQLQKLGPQAFRVGDIVSAELSFMVVPLSSGECKMLAVLRTLTLLDRTFKQVSTAHQREMLRTHNALTTESLKRKRKIIRTKYYHPEKEDKGQLGGGRGWE